LNQPCLALSLNVHVCWIIAVLFFDKPMFCITGTMYDSISVDSIKYHYRLPQSAKQTTGNQTE